MRIAGYIRLSKVEMAQDGSALERQKWAVLNAGADPDLLFIDLQSGRKDDRPNFQKVMGLVENRQIDRLVIDRFDRIARSNITNARIINTFEKSGVELFEVSLGTAVDFKNPNNWKYAQLAGIDAEYESRMLSKRINDGFAYFRYEKKANPRTPFGFKRENERYAWDDRPYLDTGKLTYEVALDWFQIFLRSKNLAEAVREIDQQYQYRWSSAGFSRWMRNPVHQGHTRYKIESLALNAPCQLVENTHEPLVPRDVIEEVEKALKRNKSGANNQKTRTYPVSGLLVCPRCGYKMSISYSAKGYVYAYCRSRMAGIKSLPCTEVDLKGKRKGINLKAVEDAIINALVGRAGELADHTANVLASPQVSSETRKIQAQIQKLQNMIVEFGDDDGIYATKIEMLRRSLSGPESNIDTEKRDILLQFSRDPAFWYSQEPEQLKRWFSLFVDRVLILDGEIQEVVLKV